MTQAIHGDSPANVQAHLRGIEYPATKSELIDTAEHNAAPSPVLDILGKLPDERYDDPEAVFNACQKLR